MSVDTDATFDVREVMPDLEAISKILVIVTGIIWAVYDILPFMTKKRGDTISEVIAVWGSKFLTLPLAFGTLMGHFFWVNPGAVPSPTVLASLLLSSIAYDIINARTSETKIPAIIPLLIGIPIGHYFWPLTI